MATSKIPTHLPPPSYHGWFFRYPNTDLISQYRPVYYPSAITPHHFRMLQHEHRNRIRTCKRILAQQRASLLAEKSAILEKFDAKKNNATAPLVDISVRLAAAGLTTDASSIFLTLHQQQQGNGSNNNAALSAFDYVRYIRAQAAPTVYQHLHFGDANFDKSVTLKMMADFGGNARAQEALNAFEMAKESLNNNSNLINKNSNKKNGIDANHILFYNSLMHSMLTCGYDNVVRVSGDVYDSIGVNLSSASQQRQQQPTAETYKHVMTSLALQAKPDEANHILTFLRSRSVNGSNCALDIEAFNIVMLGYREARMFDRVDEIWSELVDRRAFPAPNVETAEEAIRSIVELSHTPLSDQHLQLKQQTNAVERKRIPIVLNQMETLGIMRCQLAPPVLHEVERALREFSIYRHRFYEWGRAVKLFDFIEFRRKHGWLQDMRDVAIPLTSAPTMRPIGANDPTLGSAPYATEALPMHLAQRPSWERAPLEDIFNRITTDESMEDSRGGGDKYTRTTTPIHQRDASWRAKVPQTRYDALYGMTEPSMPTVGVRRHLAGGESSALGTNEHLQQRDASLVRASMSRARRTRQVVERARTHRVAAGGD